jgi:hypothetical protein
MTALYERYGNLEVCFEASAHLGFLGHRFEVIMFDAGSERPLEAVVAGHSNITAL